MNTHRVTVMLALPLCLLFLAKASAQTSEGWTDLFYDSANNRMYGISTLVFDYPTYLYYCPYTEVYLTADDTAVGYNYSNCGTIVCGECGSVGTETSTSYSPDVEYQVEGVHSVYPYFTNPSPSGYIDYYNYETYMEGLPVHFPYAYGFLGPGPDRVTSLQSIILGITNALMSQGSRHNNPHHLKVVSDITLTASCGSKDRRLTLQVVDDQGRNTGTSSVVETLHDPDNGELWLSVFNTCQNSAYAPFPCYPTDLPRGTFTDRLWVGCPSSGGDCGMTTIRSKWFWCPRGRTRVALASNLYRVRHDAVYINGSTDTITAGTNMYP